MPGIPINWQHHDLQGNTQLRYLNLGLWALTAILWIVFSFFNPYVYAGSTIYFGWLKIVISSAGVVFSYLQRPLVLLWLAIISLLPTGLYLMLTPGLFQWIGVLNLACIVSTLITRRVDKANLQKTDVF